MNTEEDEKGTRDYLKGKNVTNHYIPSGIDIHMLDQDMMHRTLGNGYCVDMSWFSACGFRIVVVKDDEWFEPVRKVCSLFGKDALRIYDRFIREYS
jgi:hypothetical protein